MNIILQIKSNVFLITILLLFFLTIGIFLFQTKQVKELNTLNNLKLNNNNYDISKPKFTINNHKRKISVSAKGGNFINENEVMLYEEVKFVSKKFRILSNNVLFNKKYQTAKSEANSTFISNKTEIKSQGFSLIEDGAVIRFKGKTNLLISK